MGSYEGPCVPGDGTDVRGAGHSRLRTRPRCGRGGGGAGGGNRLGGGNASSQRDTHRYRTADSEPDAYSSCRTDRDSSTQADARTAARTANAHCHGHAKSHPYTERYAENNSAAPPFANSTSNVSCPLPRYASSSRATVDDSIRI